MLIYVIKYKYIKKECSYLRGMKRNIGCIEITIVDPHGDWLGDNEA